MSVDNTRPRAPLHLPKELINLAAIAAAGAASVLLGGLLASVIPAETASVWLTAGAYLAPGAAVFALYWVITQRF